ncbi:MAG: Zn-dependent hydrolase [Actinobacteria bacterium]|nr:Zn-dependent hydrolase [Actinomycetota bacterium]
MPPINGGRLLQRIMDLASIGAIDGGGCARLALTDEDAAGRDLVVGWMHELGLTVTTDVIGNVIGTWNVGKGSPVMTGSHIDTVRTGGKYDGNLGVLAGLEIIETLQESSFVPTRPISVGIFTNEEGSRFAPDMLGSLVYVGGLAIEEALDIVGIDGARVGDELERIGYNGATPCPGFAPHAFVELHIEQGPVLEKTNVRIGAVTGVQGISWQEVTITGQSNHAGTTPMNMRKDPSYVAAKIAVFLRDLADRYGGHQVCTVGKVDLFPNLINVIPAKAVMTLDVRNTDERKLKKAEKEITDFVTSLSQSESVEISTRYLARFEPVVFHPQVIDIVEKISASHSPSVVRMPSGAGHDAQMFARVCPSAMVFVPSVEGISHNPAEFTEPKDMVLGTNILLQVLIELSHIEVFDS